MPHLKDTCNNVNPSNDSYICGMFFLCPLLLGLHYFHFWLEIQFLFVLFFSLSWPSFRQTAMFPVTGNNLWLWMCFQLDFNWIKVTIATPQNIHDIVIRLNCLSFGFSRRNEGTGINACKVNCIILASGVVKQRDQLVTNEIFRAVRCLGASVSQSFSFGVSSVSCVSVIHQERSDIHCSRLCLCMCRSISSL